MKLVIKALLATCGFVVVWYVISEIVWKYPFASSMAFCGLVIIYCLYKVFMLFVDFFKMIEEDKIRRKHDSNRCGKDCRLP